MKVARPRIATWIKRAGKKAFMLQRTSASRSGILLTPISAPANPWDGFSTFQRSVDDPLQDDIEYLSPESAKMAFALVIFLRGDGVRILGQIWIVRDGKV
jgi:hypothetical protein